MLDIVLFEPEIPPNTGNIIRLCANTGARLHLVEPLGFAFEDKALRRAGLDYHEFAQVRIHPHWNAVTTALSGKRWFAFSTRGTADYHQARFTPDDVLVFGPETRGLPQALLDSFPANQRLRIPMVAGSRSLNLSNTVALALFEAWRQNDFAGAAPRRVATDA
ncbi:tRNA (cytosine(34)-2'-O)-methyltransferase TrmL [Halothiobacillus diazotrophicus]|uniref:tRNA (cytidine(34)-2'-O)-methyltransferase n=1 Tax=Halothiobacillus diazotrophicus TaxID=1860122 RepID=A0A191ZHY2_9GAMM|nr:tRNA (uridine(34)/cytosine(34)/5-carboxymethylaminomethyluridine(34)-2'-O)-methyltransferase TrmL [Halothiobacillus diazotrophicus]ANJ67462.1 tRNA (cytosine(34)-2'-O)-methyltransferase TrmL [Halothiobacillus diazotrophicus]